MSREPHDATLYPVSHVADKYVFRVYNIVLFLLQIQFIKPFDRRNMDKGYKKITVRELNRLTGYKV